MKLAGWLGPVAGLICLGAVVAGAGNAWATPLPLLPVQSPGPALFTPAYNYALHGANAGNYATFSNVADAGGTVLSSLSNVPFTSAAMSFSGTLTSKVESGDSSNPYSNGTISSIPGALTFIYTLTNNSTTDAETDAAISKISLNGWAGFAVDAVLSGSGTANFEIVRSASSVDGGAVIGAYFTNYTPGGGNPYPGTTQLNAGLSSQEIVLYTNVSAYTTSYASVIGGADTASNVNILVPTTPEPSSFVLAALGLVGLAALRLRRR